METGTRFKVSSERLEKPGSNQLPFVYKASGLTTTLRRLLNYYVRHNIFPIHEYPNNISVMKIGAKIVFVFLYVCSAKKTTFA